MQRNNKTKKIKPFRIIIAFVVGVFVVFVVVSYGQELRRRVELQRHVSDLKKEITDHNQKIADLGNLLEYLKTDDYVERAAHEKLGFQNPGEHAVVVPNGGTVAGANDTQAQKNEDQISITQQWWNLFFSSVTQ
jgi:cell division protein FtsB